jgi:hypothetical protein
LTRQPKSVYDDDIVRYLPIYASASVIPSVPQFGLLASMITTLKGDRRDRVKLIILTRGETKDLLDVFQLQRGDCER